MIKCCIHICAIVISINLAAAVNDKCEPCIRRENCQLFGSLTKREQQRWIEEFSCQSDKPDEYTSLFGFAPVAKGDYICCSDNLRGFQGSETPNNGEFNGVEQRFGGPRNRGNNRGNNFRNQQNNFNNQYDRPGPRNFNNGPPNRNQGPRWPQNNNNVPFGNPNIGPNNNQMNNNFNQMRPAFPNNNMLRPLPPTNAQNPIMGPNQNDFGQTNLGGQCTDLTSFPPDPRSGCCGREASGSDRINSRNRPPMRNVFNNGWMPYNNQPNLPSWFPRGKRSPQELNVTFDNRIAGGKETDLEQFPWTVFLQTTFDYGDKTAAFNCGGALLSARYVLTAGHCVFEAGATVKKVEVTLAEYDKRTFPTDCKNILGEGKRCVQNIKILAEDVIPHPNYDDERLNNDIALLRLQGKAPYTEYIRPICLPPVDIDSPEFSNLPLAVAGWGRNGPKHKSDIKQSTVINLVPQGDCKKHYSHLTRSHLCAVGHSGEDTCKGDSGGPLMLMYQRTYYVAAVVSGKRSDAPCGTAVPSLYTNVFHYLDWIRSNIRE